MYVLLFLQHRDDGLNLFCIQLKAIPTLQHGQLTISSSSSTSSPAAEHRTPRQLPVNRRAIAVSHLLIPHSALLNAWLSPLNRKRTCKPADRTARLHGTVDPVLQEHWSHQGRGGSRDPAESQGTVNGRNVLLRTVIDRELCHCTANARRWSVNDPGGCPGGSASSRLQRTVGRLLPLDGQDQRGGGHRTAGQAQAGNCLVDPTSLRQTR